MMRTAPRAAGFALLALLLVLVLGAIGFTFARRDTLAAARGRAQLAGLGALAQARTALLGYAISYADGHAGRSWGYLPCPDPSGDGVAASGCGDAGEPALGRLPYASLGLADLRDGWGECLWYAVAASVKEAPAAQPLNWDTVGQFDIVGADGARVTDPADPHARALAVVYAPGPPLAGQPRPGVGASRCAGTAADLAGYLEAVPAAAGTGIVTVREGLPDGADNNDVLAWLTPRDVFDGLKRRADFPGFINGLIDRAEAALTARFGAAGFCGSLPGLGCGGGVAVIGLPSAAALGLSGWPAVAHDNWRDQFWLAVCTAGTPCLTATEELGAAPATVTCTAVLLFGGERVGGGPGRQERASAAQRADPREYAEGVNADSLARAGTRFSGRTEFAVGNPAEPASDDVVRCLN